MLSTVRGEMTDEERDVFERPILERTSSEGSPYYSTARLWDDGVIDPLDTRKVLALGAGGRLAAPRAHDDVRGVPDVSAVLTTREGPVPP